MSTISLLISGQLGYKILINLMDKHQIVSVFTNKSSTSIIEFCQKNNILHFVGNPRNGKAQSFIKGIECELLLSVNYLFIIEEDLINWPKKYAINVHGSLLPKYKGRTPHVWAIINGEKETGVTAHFIEEEVDNGDIIKQCVIPIAPDDTGASILKKFEAIYPKLIEDLLNDIETNSVKARPQNDQQGFYFGKRTPDDGRICWEWCKERIRNWVRAQANPYPGAFTFFNNQKVIINKAEFCDLGFHWQQDNGTILSKSENSICVKTPNGILKLENIETANPVNFEIGQRLN